MKARRAEGCWSSASRQAQTSRCASEHLSICRTRRPSDCGHAATRPSELLRISDQSIYHVDIHHLLWPAYNRTRFVLRSVHPLTILPYFCLPSCRATSTTCHSLHLRTTVKIWRQHLLLILSSKRMKKHSVSTMSCCTRPRCWTSNHPRTTKRASSTKSTTRAGRTRKSPKSARCCVCLCLIPPFHRSRLPLLPSSAPAQSLQQNRLSTCTPIFELHCSHLWGFRLSSYSAFANLLQLGRLGR
jgi:hypothetical protein